jgi:hypothetical protein
MSAPIPTRRTPGSGAPSQRSPPEASEHKHLEPGCRTRARARLPKLDQSGRLTATAIDPRDAEEVVREQAGAGRGAESPRCFSRICLLR